MHPRADVKPVLKWAGGKRQLLEPILSFVERSFPDRIENYYEPFAGGAAVFFALAGRGKFSHAKLSDMKAEIDQWRELSVGTDGDFAQTNWNPSVMR